MALCPKPVADPTIRQRPVGSRRESPGVGDEPAEAAPPELVFPASASEPPKPAGSVEPARPEVYNFRFSAGRDLKEKLERLAEVLGIANSTGRMPEVIEKALDLALEKKDPKRKLERRRKREEAAGVNVRSAGDPPASSLLLLVRTR